MKLYDITQELFTSAVYPGDMPPTFQRQMKIEEGDPCNLTVLSMCTHNGTHVDAPCHFYDGAKTIEELDLNKCIGYCTVIDLTGHTKPEDLAQILRTCEKRLLLKGGVDITLEMAQLFNEYGLELVGVESQSVGPIDAPREVHLELLGKEVVVLEGIRLEQVPEGRYLLFAAPIKLGGSDGAPCRAVLVEIE